MGNKYFGHKFFNLLCLLMAALFPLISPLSVHASSPTPSPTPESGKNEVFTYVLSSEEITQDVGSFESALLLGYTSKKPGSYYYLQNVEAAFFPINTSDFYGNGGSLSFDPSAKYYIGDTYNASPSSELPRSTTTIWSGDRMGIYFGCNITGNATFSYNNQVLSVVSANTFSLEPTAADSETFFINLTSFEGGSLSYLGSYLSRQSGFVFNPFSQSRTNWTYDISQSGSWSSAQPYYYIVGADSGTEFGPFEYGTSYPLADVSSWRTERFYIKSVISYSSTAVAQLSPSTGSISHQTFNPKSLSGTCHAYYGCKLTAGITPLSLTIEVNFPKNKEVADYLQEIISGYDSTDQEANNDKFSQSQQELQETEDSLFDGAIEGISSVDMDDYSFGKFTAMASALTFVSGFLQSAYVKMGDFGTIVTVGFVILIATKVIGLYRFSTGGDD